MHQLRVFEQYLDSWFLARVVIPASECMVLIVSEKEFERFQLEDQLTICLDGICDRCRAIEAKNERLCGQLGLAFLNTYFPSQGPFHICGNDRDFSPHKHRCPEEDPVKLNQGFTSK